MRGAGLLFYRRLASPLHAARAGVGALWAAALTAAALIFYNPLALGALTLVVLGAAVGAGVGRQLVRTLRIAVIVGLPIVVINVLASRQGLTVFARLGNLGPFGQGDLTVEAVVYGAVIALKVTLLMMITTLASLAVDPDELLRGFRRLSFRSALTATLAMRMIPVLGADAQRLAEAQKTRPENPSRGVRGRVALLSAIVGGSLERAMEVAATLELRGFAVATEGGRPAAADGVASEATVVAARPHVSLLGICGDCASLGGTVEYSGVVRGVSAAEDADRRGNLGVVRRFDRGRAAAVRGSKGDRPVILSFESVTYHYPDAEMPALDDVSFELEAGEFCLLAGLSGSGKSTLLHAACGLVPHFHGGRFAGTVTLAGLDTREHGPADLGGHAGVLFQDPETQLVMSSVRAELALALENRGQSAAAVARGVEEVALALGIDALLDRSTHELSGGEKQRVALGAALAGRPKLVLLDEPTSQLDPVAGDELIGLLRRLNEEWETTIVLAEHRLERCLGAADRVISLEGGLVAHDGDPKSFLGWAAQHEPALQTPGAKLFALSGLQPAPVGVKQARATLRSHGLLGEDGHPEPAGVTKAKARRPRKAPKALRMRGVWHELHDGPAILRGVDLTLEPGESVALMGRNGAGKSTLLRHAAGLMEPTRGRVERAGRVALLLQNPGDYLIHERVAEEASPEALEAAGLAGMAGRNPKDLSGGERQRLALAIVAGDGEAPAVLALDEPTRGMDRAAKAALAKDLRCRAEEGQAVVVATHDPEFAAACARRAVLLADGRVIADGPAAELLAGGWYFATETARILGGAGGALLPEDGAELLRAKRVLEVVV